MTITTKSKRTYPPEQRMRARQRAKERYATDPDYRARVQAQSAKWRAAHPELKRQRGREWQNKERARMRAEEPELLSKQNRRSSLRRNFGLSEEAYDRMLVAQNGLCAICRRPEFSMLNGRLKMLSVDHDHDTGTIRGLLCMNCNHGVGKFKDDPDRLRDAADYLERSK